MRTLFVSPVVYNRLEKRTDGEADRHGRNKSKLSSDYKECRCLSGEPVYTSASSSSSSCLL